MASPEFPNMLFGDASEATERAVEILRENGLDVIELRVGENATLEYGQAPYLLPSCGGFHFEGVEEIQRYANNSQAYIDFMKLGLELENQASEERSISEKLIF